MLYDKYLTATEYETVLKVMNATIEWSFTMRPMPSGCMTEAEINRRAEICGHIWNTLNELHWDPERILDYMPRYLIAMLDGKKLSDYGEEVKAAPRFGSTMWAPEVLHRTEPERRLSALAKDEPLIILPSGGDYGRHQ